MTIRELKNESVLRLREAGIENGAIEANLLLRTLLQCDAGELLLCSGNEAAPDLIQRMNDCLNRRIGGEPLQYVIGTWDFFRDRFFVGPGVLIPRPETEQLCDFALDRMRGMTSPVVFDLCAGSGCIGLSIQKHHPHVQVVLLEKSEQALSYLFKNRKYLDCEKQATVIQGDVFRGFESFPDLRQPNVIVSNPPYIESGLLPKLQNEVQKEPALALDGGADGLAFYRCFADLWLPHLAPEGLFGIECAEGQADRIAEMIEPLCRNIEILPDFNSIDRFVFARRRG